MTDEEVIAAMKAKFGSDDTDMYMVLAKATRALVHLWAEYARTPDGSLAEKIVEGHLNQMLDKMKEKPDHVVGLVESLLAIVHHMRMGGTYEDWFESLGISPIPGGDK